MSTVCAERARLDERYHATVDEYVAEVAGMRNLANPSQGVHRCKLACEQARFELERRLKEHGCGGLVRDVL